MYEYILKTLMRESTISYLLLQRTPVAEKEKEIEI